MCFFDFQRVPAQFEAGLRWRRTFSHRLGETSIYVTNKSFLASYARVNLKGQFFGNLVSLESSVRAFGDDAYKPHETHPDRTSSTYLDPPKRGLKF